MRMRVGVGWLVLSATLTWSASAMAVPPDAERLKIAAEEFDAGRRSYKLRDFENAAAHFENADRDAPSPEALQSAMRARKEAGHAARAATLAALALSRHPSEKTLVDYARQVLAESEKSLHRVGVACSPECTLVVDNRVMPFPESATAQVYVDPGPHVVIAGWSNNRHKNADVTAVAGGASRLSFTAPPIEKPPPPVETAAPAVDPNAANPRETEGDQTQEKKKAGLPRMVFFAGAGATAILTGVTVWSGIDAVNNPGTERVTRECLPNDESCSTYQEGVAHQRRTNILIVATSVVGLTTAVIGLFFTKWSDDQTKPSNKKDALVMPIVGVADGVNLGVVGRF